MRGTYSIECHPLAWTALGPVASGSARACQVVQLLHRQHIKGKSIAALRVDQFWYKYAYMEELLANYAGRCRRAWLSTSADGQLT